MVIRNMTLDDWPQVRSIYQSGIDTGSATFQTEAPQWEEWDAAHKKECRLVAEADGLVVAFAALSPTSKRECYAGVCEVSLYTAPGERGKGVGTALMRELVARSEEAGIWMLYASIFETNNASLKMCENAGFRRIGYREAIAKDADGVWRNTVLVERRSKNIW